MSAETESFVPVVCTAVVTAETIARGTDTNVIGAELVFSCKGCGIYESIDRVGTEYEIDSMFSERTKIEVKTNCQKMPSYLRDLDEIPTAFLPRIVKR